MRRTEEKDAFNLTIQIGKATGAKLLLATDPDADSLGVAVLHEGEYRLLTGNEVGALVLHYLLSNHAMPPNTAVVKRS